MKDDTSMKRNETQNEHSAKKLEYRVKLFNDFTEPFAYGEDLDKIVNHITYDAYVAYDYSTFCKALDEFLDAPSKKMTVADVRKDFDTSGRTLSKDKVKVIQSYYNGRYDLSKKIYKELALKFDPESVDEEHPWKRKFNIPFHMNFFTCEDNDPYDSAVKMNDAFIEIEICTMK